MDITTGWLKSDNYPHNIMNIYGYPYPQQA